MNEGLGFTPLSKLGKIGLNGIAGLVGLRKNRYIRGNLWFSYDRVLRVGPPGPALFYYLNLPCPERGLKGGSGNRPDLRLGPA
jgi:hypothetical protein